MVKRRSRAKQSPIDRMKRLQDGCCPIHNMHFSQGGWDEQDGVHYCFIVCPRRDCSVGVYCYDELGGGPWDLLPEFSHLIAPDYAHPNEWVRIQPSAESQQYCAARRARIAASRLDEQDDADSLSDVCETQGYTLDESNVIGICLEKYDACFRFCWFCGQDLYYYVENENGRAAHGSYPCKVNLCDGSPTVVFACPVCSAGKKRIPLEIYRRRLYDRTPAGETLLSLHKALELETIADAAQVEAIKHMIADLEQRHPISEFKFWGEQNPVPQTGELITG